MMKKYPTYNDLYESKKSFVENLHDCLKLRAYKFNEDYIELDLGEYIAFCPFKFEILYNFRGFFRHCVTRNKSLWDSYFNSNYYGYGDLKTFFFKKDATTESIGKDRLWEFTCWINVRQTSLHMKNNIKMWMGGNNFYLCHDANNSCTNEVIEYCTKIIENNYDKIVKCFMNTRRYKILKPKKLR